MKHKGAALCLAAFFCFLLVFPVSAATTANGYSGLINIPSAYVLRQGQGGLGYFNLRDGESFVGSFSVFSGFELGYSRWLPDVGKNVNVYSAKVVVLQERVLKPAIAVGVSDLADQLDRSYYVMASKQGPWGVRLHLGAQSGEKSALMYGLEKQFRLTGDLRKALPFIPVFNLMLEYDGQGFNYGAYVRSKNGLRLDLGWRDDRFYAGAQLEF